MNHIYCLLILLFFASCTEERCSLDSRITNFESTPEIKELQGKYYSTVGEIEINISTDNESDRGMFTVNRKLKNGSCEQKGSFTIFNLAEASRNFDRDYALMCSLENVSTRSALRIAKFNDKPAILIPNVFLDSEDCSKMIAIAGDCSYLTLERE